MFALCTIRALQIDSSGNEFLVTFISDISEKIPDTVYGMTRKCCIEGLAWTEERENARKRWLGKTIYSRKRHINTYNSASGILDNAPVSISEKLTVIDITWGLTPLPPQPLWVWVRTPNGDTGFIPTRFSWTNTIDEIRTDTVPWNDNILEKNPKDVYTWDEEIWEYIDRHKIITSMTTPQVLLSWGEPLTRTTISRNDSDYVRLEYDGQYLHFYHDTLTALENK
jgi:hypothetical protein